MASCVCTPWLERSRYDKGAEAWGWGDGGGGQGRDGEGMGRGVAERGKRDDIRTERGTEFLQHLVCPSRGFEALVAHSGYEDPSESVPT